MNIHLNTALLLIFISTATIAQKNSSSSMGLSIGELGNQSTCALFLTSRGTRNRCSIPRLAKSSQITQFKQGTTTGLSYKNSNRRGTRYQSKDNPDSSNILRVTHAKLNRRGSR